MNFNQRSLMDFAKIRSYGKSNFTILDFGCGAGEIVTAGILCGMNIFGAEVFYGGAEDRPIVEKSGLLGTIIREIKNGSLDFPDHYFDLVISNQVLEHIKDLDKVLFEVNRVLKPGGVMINIFPSDDIWREGHCGIPFLHWFSKSSKLRFPYALWLRRLGLGKHKDQWGSVEEWTRHKISWLDRYCFYRDRRTLMNLFGQYFLVKHFEGDVIVNRLNSTKLRFLSRVVNIWPLKPLAQELYRKLGGLVILAQRK